MLPNITRPSETGAIAGSVVESILRFYHGEVVWICIGMARRSCNMRAMHGKHTHTQTHAELNVCVRHTHRRGHRKTWYHGARIESEPINGCNTICDGWLVGAFRWSIAVAICICMCGAGHFAGCRAKCLLDLVSAAVVYNMDDWLRGLIFVRRAHYGLDE